MRIDRHIPQIEEILGKWKGETGKDYNGYENHVYRVVNFCFNLHHNNQNDKENFIIAG